MQVFLDTQIIFGNFGENAELRLDELLRLVKEKKIVFIYTAQLENEYLRGVGDRISQTRKSIKKSEVSLKVEEAKKDGPKMDPEFKVSLEKGIKAIKDGYAKHQSRRLKSYDSKVKKIEKIVAALFRAGKKIPYTDEIIEAAKLRHIKGNPPKKDNDNSYGDAINWESLLKHSKDDDLIVITKDSDYLEANSESFVLNRLLIKEWKEVSKKELTHYLGIGSFLNAFEDREVVPDSVIKKEERVTVNVPRFDWLNENGLYVADALTRLGAAQEDFRIMTAGIDFAPLLAQGTTISNMLGTWNQFEHFDTTGIYGQAITPLDAVIYRGQTKEKEKKEGDSKTTPESKEKDLNK